MYQNHSATTSNQSITECAYAHMKDGHLNQQYIYRMIYRPLNIIGLVAFLVSIVPLTLVYCCCEHRLQEPNNKEKVIIRQDDVELDSNLGNQQERNADQPNRRIFFTELAHSKLWESLLSLICARHRVIILYCILYLVHYSNDWHWSLFFPQISALVHYCWNFDDNIGMWSAHSYWCHHVTWFYLFTRYYTNHHCHIKITSPILVRPSIGCAVHW